MTRMIKTVEGLFSKKDIRTGLTIWLIVATLSTPNQVSAQMGVEKEWAATAVSLQGQVAVRKSDSKQWQTVQLGDRFHVGDTINVGPDSRAAFVLKNESTLRVDQHTTLVFSEAEPNHPFVIQLITGALHFFSRVQRSLRLATPFVNGAVEGTEFFARVDADRTTLSLFEGRLKVFNSQGSIRLEKNKPALQWPISRHSQRRWCAPATRLTGPCITRR